MRIITINKNNLPYRVNMKFKDITYQLFFRYNIEHDFFTVDLLLDNKIVVAGEKLVLNKFLFSAIAWSGAANLIITPLNPDGSQDRITFRNMNNEVKIFVLKEV